MIGTGRLLVALPACLCVLTYNIFAQSSCTYVDPHEDSSGYAAWCRCMGGTPYPFQGSVACQPGGGHRDSSAPYTNPRKYTPPSQPDSSDAEAREKTLAAERARRTAEEKRREDEKFQQDKADALKTMKSISSDDLGLKGVGVDSSTHGSATTLGLKRFEENSAADVVREEQQKREQEELAFAKKHSGLSPEPPSPPPLTVPGAMDRLKIALSDDAERLADLRKEGVFSLPQTTRAKIRKALLHYLLEHIPSRYAQTYWNINKGAADDTNGIFDAIRRDFAERGGWGQILRRRLRHSRPI